MKYLYYLLRYIVTLAADVFVVPLVLFIHLWWGRDLHMEGISVCTTLRRESWPLNPYGAAHGSGWLTKYNFFGITLGHGIIYGPDAGYAERVHEHVHEHQYEASMVKSCIIGLLVLLVTGKLWLSYVIWLLGYALYLGANCLTAVIRGDHAYYDCVHEEHARAIEGAPCNEKTIAHYQQKYKKTL